MYQGITKEDLNPSFNELEKTFQTKRKKKNVGIEDMYDMHEMRIAIGVLEWSHVVVDKESKTHKKCQPRLRE